MTDSSFFGADKISFTHLETLQANAPDIIIWAAPFMFLFVIIEMTFSHFQNRKLYNTKETIGSTGLGIGNVIIASIIKTGLFVIFILVYNILPWRMQFSWWSFIPCYILFDLCSYWAHRVSHIQRFWWATHIAHHSGEYYNLSVSFRLSWVQYIKLIFLLPAALVGFHPVIFFVTNQVAVLFQFWVHTEYIRKMPRIIEYIFATPSNHRVHHGSQEKYINKNYGATFILWDRIFGTYQQEEEQVIYGITSEMESKTNPIYLNFNEYREMWTDVKQADGWKQKMFYIFGDPAEIARVKNDEVKNSPEDDSVQRVIDKYEHALNDYYEKEHFH